MKQYYFPLVFRWSERIPDLIWIWLNYLPDRWEAHDTGRLPNGKRYVVITWKAQK